MSKAKPKQIPVFGSEDEERAFWAEQDSTDYVSWNAARRRSFPNLRPTLRTISLRLPEAMIGHLKVLANKRDVPYQSLLKQFLAERLQRELAKGAYPTAQRTRSASPPSPLSRKPLGDTR